MFGIRTQLAEIRRLVERIEVALLVRDPGSTRAAEAYDGLRKQILAATAERRAHLVQLAELDAAVRRSPDPEQLRQRLDDWLNQQGIVRRNDPNADRELFDIAGSDGDGLVVDHPAYVDGKTEMVIKRGRARRVAIGGGPPPPAADGDAGWTSTAAGKAAATTSEQRA
jgi:hypothetical protein